MADGNPEVRTSVPAWGLPALLGTGVVLSRVFLACLEGMLGAGALEAALHYAFILLPVLAVPLVPYWTVGVYRARGGARASIFLLLSCLAVFFVISQASAVDQVQIVLYFLLGTALYRARSAWGRSAGVRCWLDIFLALMITGFLEELVKGLSPAYLFDFGINSRIAAGLVGALFARNLHVDRPYGLNRNRSARNYKGTAPLLDLHFYWRDIAFAGLVATLFLLPPTIHSFYVAEDIAGTWSVPVPGGPRFRLGNDGWMRCVAENAAGVPMRRWHVEGNLLDGYFLSFTCEGQPKGLRCSFLAPWMDRRSRFRLRGDTLVFDNATSDWVWPLQTLLRRKAPQEAPAWKRLE